jgi:parvulin-like peptidyl-prolyl isomerase
MTFRARPVARRSGRPGWDPGTRRTTVINAGFAGAIIVSLLILLGYAGWTWYQSHFGTAATVDGAVITNDDVRARLKIENFRIDYTEAQVRAAFAAGHITQDVETQQLQYLDQTRQSITSIALEKLVDVSLQAKLANDDGIAVTDAAVQAELTKEETTPEQRHVWMIEVEPATDPTTGQVTDATKAAAKTKADQALADLKSGKAWEDVAKADSTAASAPQAGDLGWLQTDSGYDTKFMTAVFAAPQNQPTDVVVGDDGTYRIGRVTEVEASAVDSAFETKLQQADIPMDQYLVAVKADVVRNMLSDKVVADLSKPSVQRHVLQIKLCAPGASGCPAIDSTDPNPTGVKVRHILFSPNDDPANASKLSADDPAWKKAHDEAVAAYNQLLVNPDLFDQLARTMSDEASAKDDGGKQPWYTPDSPLDPAFLSAIMKPGLRPGQILTPVKSQFGWHVIQFMRPYGDGDESWLEAIKAEADDQHVDFGQLARDQGEGTEASKGGDVGWVAKGQLDKSLEDAIFAATVGSTTTVVDVSSDGDYLFKVVAEETRPADDAQIKVFKDSGFSTWYADQKSQATITRATDSSTSG